jgi:hypothetical protein
LRTGVGDQDLGILHALGLPNSDALVQDEALVEERVLLQRGCEDRLEMKKGMRNREGVKHEEYCLVLVAVRQGDESTVQLSK